MQVAARGKLFNVVVDTENTGKMLLQNGDLQRRVTIIPLNKIQNYTISKQIQDAAVKMVCVYCLYSETKFYWDKFSHVTCKY